MIEIEREERAINGRWGWHVVGRPEYRGRSREPLLDACRALKSLGEPVDQLVGLFQPGRTDWDLRATIGYGASKTVIESDYGPRLRKTEAR
jgi:hypothetical protein